MKIYDFQTGKTKTDELRVTRSIGALWVRSSKKIEDLQNEKISIYLESPSGKNVELASNVSLKHFILGSTFGESKIKSDVTAVPKIGLGAICELAADGSVTLGVDEVLKISLTGLNPAEYYGVNGLEYPQGASHIVTYDRKTILSEEPQRTYAVHNADVLVIDSASVTKIEFTFNNGMRISYDMDELKAAAFDMEDIITVDEDGTTSVKTGDILTFPLTDVLEIRVDKETPASVELTLVNLNY